MAESEADTPSTPIEFESKYFEFDGVRLPPFCRGKMEEIAGFSLRSSDIWIVTYPKSGKQPVMSACEAALRTDTLLSARAQRVAVPCATKGWMLEVWRYNAFYKRRRWRVYTGHTRARQRRIVAFCIGMFINVLIRATSGRLKKKKKSHDVSENM